jgi:hypothetical protein
MLRVARCDTDVSLSYWSNTATARGFAHFPRNWGRNESGIGVAPRSCGIHIVRVRITRRPPASYGTDGEALHVGSVYNLDSSLASALMVDDCAELFEALPEKEKQRSGGGFIWQSPDRQRRRNRCYPELSDF